MRIILVLLLAVFYLESCNSNNKDSINRDNLQDTISENKIPESELKETVANIYTDSILTGQWNLMLTIRDITVIKNYQDIDFSKYGISEEFAEDIKNNWEYYIKDKKNEYSEEEAWGSYWDFSEKSVSFESVKQASDGDFDGDFDCLKEDPYPYHYNTSTHILSIKDNGTYEVLQFTPNSLVISNDTIESTDKFCQIKETLLFFKNAENYGEKFTYNNITYDILSPNDVAVCNYILNPNDESMWDFEYYQGNVKIPSKVAYNGKEYNVIYIGEMEGDDLDSVEIPTSVILIGSYAFSGSGIKSINLPNSIIYLGAKAFESCRNLVSVNIPTSLQVINEDVFEYCENLKSIYIPDNIKEIKSDAFRGCVNLENVSVSENTIISESAFEDCPKLKLTIRHK